MGSQALIGGWPSDFGAIDQAMDWPNSGDFLNDPSESEIASIGLIG